MSGDSTELTAGFAAAERSRAHWESTSLEYQYEDLTAPEYKKAVKEQLAKHRDERYVHLRAVECFMQVGSGWTKS